MRTATPPLREARVIGGAMGAARLLEDLWQRGAPDLRQLWNELGPSRSLSELAALVKVDLRCRFVRGQRPAVADYLGEFPELGDRKDRVVSLIYEEFCLRADQGERPDAAQFCERYAPWKDSLAWQLGVHEALSQIITPTPEPTQFPAPGEQFREFSLRFLLGLGGSARVYLARDESLGGREVVLKIYPDRGTEASILGRLDHAHIVPVHSTLFDPESKLRGLCMPYRPGVPLDEVIRRVKPASRPRSALALWNALSSPPSDPSAAVAAPPPPAPMTGLRPEGPGWESFPIRGSYADGVAWVIAKLAEALEHAHSRNVQHRDVKPANILLTYREGPQLLDFNLAHDRVSASQVEAALRGGTLPYMSPEQLSAFSDPTQWDAVDERADLYSLGLVLRELLTGEAPDLPNANLPVLRAIRDLLDRREGFQPALRAVNPRIPHALESITARCLAHHPADRYQSASELAVDLKRYLARRPLIHAPNPSKGELIANLARRFRLPLFLLTTVAIAYGIVESDRWIHTVEERRPFLSVIAAIGVGDYDKAVRVVTSNELQLTSSPVVSLHYAFAELKRGKQDIADRELARAWKQPGALGALLKWGRDHPELVGRALELGDSQIAASTDPKYDPSIAQQVSPFESAGNTFDLVHRLAPENLRALLGLAIVAEHRRDYAGARRLLTDVIASNPLPTSIDERAILWKSLHTRARVSTASAEARLKVAASEADLGEANALFVEAIGDLNRVRQIVGPDERKLTFLFNFITSQAELGLADVALRRGNDLESRRHLRDAKNLLERLSPPAESQRWVDELARRIRERLAQETLPAVDSHSPE